jgi:hypothetical protein
MRVCSGRITVGDGATDWADRVVEGRATAWVGLGDRPLSTSSGDSMRQRTHDFKQARIDTRGNAGHLRAFSAKECCTREQRFVLNGGGRDAQSRNRPQAS